MQDVIIVCAGSYGKEAYWLLMTNNNEAKKKGEEEPYNILGFINDIPNALEGSKINVPILGTIKDWKPTGNEKYVLGLGTPESKKKVVSLLKSRGAQFMSLMPGNCNVSPDLTMGEGCLITRGSIIGADVQLGDFVNVHASMIYSGARIGSFSTTTGFTVIENATLEEGVHLGSKAVITSGVTVGRWSKVAAGSVVIENVRPGTTVFGMPAQELA